MKLKIILSLNIFFCGPRKLNIILTQLRNSASFLNFYLFRVGIVSDPSCRCGAALENLKHFFLDSPIYIHVRTILIGNINRVRDRPFNLKGGYGFLFRSEIFFRTTQELEYYFFLSR